MLKENSDSRFKSLFDQSPVSMIIVSREGKVLASNNQFKQLWGMPEVSASQALDTDYCIFNDLGLIRVGQIPLLKKAFEGEIVNLPEFYYDPTEHRYIGRARWVEGVVFPIKSDDGEIIEIVLSHYDTTAYHESHKVEFNFKNAQPNIAIIPDILEHKRNEDTLNFIAAIKSTFLSLLDYNKVIKEIAITPIPFLADGCIVDLMEDGKLKRIITKHHDPESEKIMIELEEKFAPAQYENHPSYKIIQAPHTMLVPKVDIEYIKSRCMNDEHIELVKRLDVKSHIAVPLEIHGSVIGALNYIITTNRKPFDVKDLQTSIEIGQAASFAIENALLYQNAQHAVAQRDHFISLASHELRTPITSLNLYLEIIAKDFIKLSPTEESKLIIEKTFKQVKRIHDLVDKMLDLSRIDQDKLSLNKKIVNISQVINETINRFIIQFEKNNTELTLDIADSLFADCDAFRIDQVLTNLITNALRYGNKRPVKISLQKIAEKIVLKVEDQGPGIDPKDHDRIFNRFERIGENKDTSGLGLGLYLSKQIIDDHKGKIYIVSKINSGATFIVELPKVESL